MALADPQPQALEPGEVMVDGTVYAGVSPDAGKPLYAMPADVSALLTFNDAAASSAALKAHGHDDWRVPTREELRVLFNNAAAIGGFDTTGQGHATWYWSSTSLGGNDIAAICQRFSDGFQEPGYKTDPLSIRYVRTDDANLLTKEAEAKAQARSALEIRDRLRHVASRMKLMPEKGPCSSWKPCGD